MIKQLTTALVLLFSFGFMLNSCSNDDDDSKKNEPKKTASKSGKIKLAIPVRYDSAMNGGAVKQIWMNGPTVKIFSTLDGKNLLLKRDVKKITDPPSDFAANTSYRQCNYFAVFKNNNNVLKGDGKAYLVKVEDFDYKGVTLSAEQAINVRKDSGWVQKIIHVKEQ